MARGAHKVNPIGFRIGINKNWVSRWYAKTPEEYAENIKSDKQARQLISKRLSSAGVDTIVIKRDLKKVTIEKR